MYFSALTWIGFMVVALGWALLLTAEPALVIYTNFTGRNLPSLANLAAIAQCAIITGFGLAIVGTLRTGFGALKNFFDTVLERTAHRGANVGSAEPRAALPKAKAEPSFTPAPVRAPAPAASVVTRHEPRLAKKAKIVERGRLKDRGYVLFGDGSVEVETLLGLRRFASLGEAHKFIS
jgi:hypothetical protein